MLLMKLIFFYFIGVDFVVGCGLFIVMLILVILLDDLIVVIICEVVLMLWLVLIYIFM